VFLVDERLERFRDLVRLCERSGVVAKVVSPDELARVAATQHHEGICIEATPVRTWGIKDFARRMASVQRGVLVWLEGVDNPHNIGAILRTSCFFGARGVILQSSVFSALSGATCRVAEGAAELLDTTIIREGAQLRELLRDGGWSVVATTPHQARSVYSVAWPEKVVLVFGAEGTGVSPDSLADADQRVSVPRLGPIESLNVATCVGVVLAEACRGAVLRGSVRVLGNTPAARAGVDETGAE
jgi:TrmH RNA methyltransferase